jgi:hypothetical protein
MNYQMGQCNMNYPRQPATEALEHLATIRCNSAMPPRAMATHSNSSLKFDMNKLFHAAASMQQQQDSMQFPVIAWSSDDDERENSDDQDIDSPEAASNNSISSDEGKKEELGSKYKLATKRGLLKRPQQEDSKGAHRMVRSKALHSELSLLASSLSTSRGSSTQRHGIVSELA